MKQETALDQDLIAPIRELLKPEYLKETNILNLLPVAVYVCNGAGRIISYNQKAAALWGRTPQKEEKDEHFLSSFKLYDAEGTYLPYHQTPVAACLLDGEPRENAELIVERPDLSRLVVRANIVPIKDEQGAVQGVISCFYDITAQKRAQDELLQKTKELQDYLDNAVIGLHWVDENGIIKWANPAELDMLGYTADEYIGHHIAEFHADGAKINDILQRLSCKESLNGYETTLRCKDGSVKTVQISSNVFWEEGKFIHTRCFTIDVTSQKKLFNALQESEGQYRKLVEALQTPLYTTDAEGRIRLFNKAAADLWGRSPRIGTDMWCGSHKIFRPDGSELPLSECPMAVCLKEKRPVYGKEILVARPDGSVRNVAVYPQPFFDDAGELTGAVNMLVDITAVKDTELALRESEKKYRELATSLTQSIDEKTRDLERKSAELKKSEERYHKMVEEVEDYAIILLDKDGIVQNWNRGAEKIKGYKEEDIVGKSFRQFYLPEDRERGLPIYLLEMAREKGKATHEGWRMRKDGTAFWGSIVLTALHNDEGAVIGFTKVTRDLTEKKLSEDKMREYTSQLEFQNKELEQFAYAASHDMKEPLRKIHFYNSFVSENASNHLDEKSKEYLNRSAAAVKRMNTLIEDLLAYSRATSMAENFEAVDVNEVVEEIMLLHKEELEQKKVRIEFASLPTIKAVPFQFKQLMDNLINNAVKYKHPDRDAIITIKSSVVPGAEVKDRHAEADKQYYKISVIDNGIGFQAEHAERIFEIFQRLNKHPGAKGSGIGLAICKRIVQNHRGFIRASGRENAGARFDVFFPVDL